MECRNQVDWDHLKATMVGTNLSGMLKKIRDFGWRVAVHNDYRLNGEWYTFWLFTKRGSPGAFNEAVKGEGKTDEEALSQVLQQMKAVAELKG